jgi:hypothetical protein
MRFNNYLNESFEDKVFILIDNFMQEKGMTSGEDLLKSNTWKELLAYFTETSGIKVSIYRSKDGGITGHSSIEGIDVVIPNGPITTKIKGGILATLFHEYNHQMQDKDNPTLHYGYMHVSHNSHSLMEYSNYFLQKTERKS